MSGGAAATPVRRKASASRKIHATTQPEAPAASMGAGIAAAAGAALAPVDPTYDAIARLAYSYWEARGCQGGCPEEDWLRAEQELRLR